MNLKFKKIQLIPELNHIDNIDSYPGPGAYLVDDGYNFTLSFVSKYVVMNIIVSPEIIEELILSSKE